MKIVVVRATVPVFFAAGDSSSPHRVEETSHYVSRVCHKIPAAKDPADGVRMTPIVRAMTFLNC